MPLAHKHKLIAFGVDAHGEVRRLAGRIRRRFFEKLTAGRNYLTRALDDVCHLEAEPRPRPLSVAAAVDADDRPCDVHFTDDISLTKDPRLQRAAIEFHGPLHVRRPDDVLCAFNLHEKQQYLINRSNWKRV